MISVSGAIVRIYVANSKHKKTYLKKGKGVVRRESGVKKGGRSGECMRVEDGREIGGVKDTRATKGWGSIYKVTVGREI